MSYRPTYLLSFVFKKCVCAAIGIEDDEVLNQNVVLDQNDTGSHVPEKNVLHF